MQRNAAIQAVLISWTLAATVAAQCNYDAIELPGFACGPSTHSAGVRDINNDGVIVGRWLQCNGEDYAIYYWSPKDGLHPEFFLPPTAHTAEATAINDKGNFIGFARDGLNKAFGWAWIDGAYQVIAIPPGMGNAIELVGINNYDEIVGWFGTPPLAERHAFRWKNGALTVLDDILGSTNACAVDINDSGQIAGRYFAGGPAFLLEGDRVSILPQLPGSAQSRPKAINANGIIVGNTLFNDQGNIYYTATRWENGVVSDLGLLPGEDSSEAVDINIFGTSVGNAGEGVMWLDTALLELADLTGGMTGNPKAINNQGMIVVTDGDPFLFVPRDRPDADINVDCCVDAVDLAMVLSEWGRESLLADIDQDGIVGPGDLAAVLSEWSR